jgi:hypothetical protein
MRRNRGISMSIFGRSTRNRNSARSLLLAIVTAPLFLTACGSQDTQDAPDTQDAQDERARNAADGEPVAPRNTDTPEPDEYDFGTPAATAHNGEVVAYVPRLKSRRIIVPLTIHNKGDKRASYTVTVTADRGERGSPTTVTKKATNVSPGTTWPTQADISAPGSWNLNRTKISLKVSKDNYPFGDSR